MNRMKVMMHIEKSRTRKGWVAHLNGAWPITQRSDWPRHARQWRCVLEWNGGMHMLVARTLRELDARLQALANCTDSAQ